MKSVIIMMLFFSVSTAIECNDDCITRALSVTKMCRCCYRFQRFYMVRMFHNSLSVNNNVAQDDTFNSIENL